jgi:hypothetical protein
MESVGNSTAKNEEITREIERVFTNTLRKGISTLELTRIEVIRQPAIYRSLSGVPPGVRDAQVIIVILSDLRMVQTSVLGASTVTGTTVIMMAEHRPPYKGEFRTILGVPEVFTIQMMVPIGFPAY